MSRSLSLSLAALLALTYGAGAFADASYQETIRLVRSMREDELLMEAVHAKSAQQLKKNKADKRAACLVNAKYPYLTDAIAWVISSQLTDAEVTEAIAFYRSLGAVGMAAALVPLPDAMNANARQMILAALVAAWALRLGLHIAIRSAGWSARSRIKAR